MSHTPLSSLCLCPSQSFCITLSFYLYLDQSIFATTSLLVLSLTCNTVTYKSFFTLINSLPPLSICLFHSLSFTHSLSHSHSLSLSLRLFLSACLSVCVSLLLFHSLSLSLPYLSSLHFFSIRLIVSLGHGKKYHASNPFPWMDLISLEGKTNFFERRVGEYQKANVMLSSAASDVNSNNSDAEGEDSGGSSRNKLNLDADF